MKLHRCIGGKSNGDFWAIEYWYREGDVVRIPVQQKLISLTDDYMPSFDEIPKIVTQEIELYIISVLHFKNRPDVKYLRHETMNEYAALSYLLER